MEPSCLTNFFQSEYEADFSIFLSLHQPRDDFGDKNLVVTLENDPGYEPYPGFDGTRDTAFACTQRNMDIDIAACLINIRIPVPYLRPLGVYFLQRRLLTPRKMRRPWLPAGLAL